MYVSVVPSSRRRLQAAAALTHLTHRNEHFHLQLPGVAPQDFQVGDPVKIKVNKLSSAKNLPFDFYSLYSFCKPASVHSFHENLGEVLRGDRIENSVFEGYFRQDEHCGSL